MPSEKRQRIRENRAKKVQAQASIKRKGANKRRLAYMAVGAVVAIVAIYFASKSSSSKSAAPPKSASAVTTTTKVNAIAPVCPPAAGSAKREIAFTKAPPMCINTSKTYTAVVKTDVGTFDVALNAKEAPKTVNNFVFLARYHFYDGITFHRVIPSFVVQGGDPTGTGAGGPGYTFADELPKSGSYKLGSVAMANSGPNTNGSQFFIVVGSQGEQLPPKYSLFGQVTSGMSVVQKIAADGSTSGTPKVVHKMISVTIQG